MTTVIYSLLGFIIAIGLLTTVHEFGHFWVAKKLGVKVLRFSIGFGKPLLSWYDKLGTEYVIAAIPLGGYVKMLDQTEGVVAPNELHRAFNNKPVWARMLIITAGPIFNLIFAVIAYWGVFMLGIVTVVPILGNVQAGSVADVAGLKAGQEIVAIDGRATTSWEDVAVALISKLGTSHSIDIKVQQPPSKQVTDHKLDLRTWEFDKHDANIIQSLGIAPPKVWTANLLRMQRYTAWPALQQAVGRTAEYTVLTVKFLGKMVKGQLSMQHIAGPIAIAQLAGRTAESGLAYFLGFLALVSISLGVLNMLPIPMLDGGHFLFCLIELVSGKPLPAQVIDFAHRLGFAVLGSFMLLALYNDVLRIST